MEQPKTYWPECIAYAVPPLLLGDAVVHVRPGGPGKVLLPPFELPRDKDRRVTVYNHATDDSVVEERGVIIPPGGCAIFAPLGARFEPDAPDLLLAAATAEADAARGFAGEDPPPMPDPMPAELGDALREGIKRAHRRAEADAAESRRREINLLVRLRNVLENLLQAHIEMAEDGAGMLSAELVSLLGEAGLKSKVAQVLVRRRLDMLRLAEVNHRALEEDAGRSAGRSADVLQAEVQADRPADVQGDRRGGPGANPGL